MTSKGLDLRKHCPKVGVFHQHQLGGFPQCSLMLYTASQPQLAEVCQAVADETDVHDLLSLLGPVGQLSLLVIMHLLPRFIHVALGNGST